MSLAETLAVAKPVRFSAAAVRLSLKVKVLSSSIKKLSA
jgi:hypothetical protein